MLTGRTRRSAAPKFPRPAELDALLAHAAVGGSASVPAAVALDMAAHTLRAMCAGGIYDHVGGGFARYSVDEFWHVPHFEKMLYDNAQLAVTLCDAAVAAAAAGRGDDADGFASTARGTLDYLRRDMTHPQGGIFSAEDADSQVAPGGAYKEGWFYLWTLDELHGALGGAARLFCDHYGVKPGGNADLSERSDPQGEFRGHNILRAVRSEAASARKLGLQPAEARALLADARARLHAARAQRPRPRLDNKVIAAWNGLAISGLAVASRALAAFPDAAQPRFPVDGAPPRAYADAAAAAARFIRERLYGAPSRAALRKRRRIYLADAFFQRRCADPATRSLRRSFCNSPSAAEGFADDYAFMIGALRIGVASCILPGVRQPSLTRVWPSHCAVGLLDLYEARGDVTWLGWARELWATLNERFWDDAGAGGYFSSPAGAPDILLRLKEDYDGAEPSASSRAAAAAFRLAALCGHGSAEGAALRARGRAAVAAFAPRLRDIPLAMPALCAAAALDDPAHEATVLLIGTAAAPVTEALADAAFAARMPLRRVIHLDFDDAACIAFWRELNPGAVATAEPHAAETHGGKAAVALVCAAQACRPPVREPAALTALLREAAAAGTGGAGGMGSAKATPFDLPKAFGGAAREQ